MRRQRARWAEGALLTGYVALTAAALVYHEPWRDEAQAWLIARDLPVPAILRQMPYEGTPALWHLMLAPLAKSGLPYAAGHVLHLAVAVAAVGLLLFRAPLPLPLKAVFVFSYYMAYEYSVIARNYALSILILFLIAARHRTRLDSPLRYAALLFLLFNTNVHSFAIAAGLSGVFLVELARRPAADRRLLWASALLAAAGAAAAVWQVHMPSRDLVSQVAGRLDPQAIPVAVRDAFVPWVPPWLSPGVALWAGAAVVALSLAYLARVSVAPLAGLVAGLGGIFYVFAFRHPGALRHHGLILVFLLFSLWIAGYHERARAGPSPAGAGALRSATLWTLGLCLAFSVIATVKIHVRDGSYMFSGAREMAKYIVDHGLAGRTIVGYRSPPASSLLPYMPSVRFWYPDVQRFGTYISWGDGFSGNQNLSASRVLLRARRNGLAMEDILLLSSRRIRDPSVLGLKLLHETPGKVFGYGRESYHLYGPAAGGPGE